jgi:hypothetical protein
MRRDESDDRSENESENGSARNAAAKSHCCVRRGIRARAEPLARCVCALAKHRRRHANGQCALCRCRNYAARRLHTRTQHIHKHWATSKPRHMHERQHRRLAAEVQQTVSVEDAQRRAALRPPRFGCIEEKRQEARQLMSQLIVLCACVRCLCCVCVLTCCGCGGGRGRGRRGGVGGCGRRWRGRGGRPPAVCLWRVSARWRIHRACVHRCAVLVGVCVAGQAAPCVPNWLQKGQPTGPQRLLPYDGPSSTSTDNGQKENRSAQTHRRPLRSLPLFRCAAALSLRPWVRRGSAVAALSVLCLGLPVCLGPGRFPLNGTPPRTNEKASA